MMLLGASRRFSIVASDGRLGAVSDFLFDDATWHVRWMVVRTGTWLAHRISLVHLSDVGQVDYDRRSIAVRLTRAQVEASPDILLDEPVSRQIEYGLHEFIGWEPEWGETRYVAGPLSVLGVRVSQSRLDEEKAMHKAPHGGLTGRGDPHLRSVAAIVGNDIRATDGNAAHIKDFLADESGWAVRHIVVDTTRWQHGRHVLVPPSKVIGISWPDHEVRLAITSSEVKACPRYDQAGI